MQRTTLCLQTALIAGLAALMAFATPPALSAEPNRGEDRDPLMERHR